MRRVGQMQATESELCVKCTDKLRVIIADDHKIFREGLQMILESEPDIDVVAETGAGVEAVRLAEELVPDLILMDIMMPDMNGIDATRRISERMPEIPVLVLSMHEERQLVIEALAAGAKGYLVKECAAVELLTAIRNIDSGGIYLSRKVAGTLLREIPQQPAECNSPSSIHLSIRELEIIQLIAEGKNTKEIASFLDRSVKTVGTHRVNIMRKLKVDSIAEVVKYTIRNSLISQ